jgi:hypothetical protein
VHVSASRTRLLCGCLLLFRDALVAHALSRLRYLAQHVLPRHVAGAQHPCADSKVGAVPSEPSSRRLYHCEAVKSAVLALQDVKLESRVGKRRTLCRDGTDVARHDRVRSCSATSDSMKPVGGRLSPFANATDGCREVAIASIRCRPAPGGWW